MLTLALLLCGAIVNVAVAWGFALYGGNELGIPTSKWVYGIALTTNPSDTYTLQKDAHFALGFTFESVAVLHFGDIVHQPFRALVGWPARSLQYRIPPNENEDTNWLDRGIETNISARFKYAPPNDPYGRLPVRPLWPGFAINTIFYAAILWALFAVPLALRRRRRIKRGQCPACAYPIGTSPVCTECGKQLA